jgi:Na+(H+)/acetate symporter ActP
MQKSISKLQCSSCISISISSTCSRISILYVAVVVVGAAAAVVVLHAVSYLQQPWESTFDLLHGVHSFQSRTKTRHPTEKVRKKKKKVIKIDASMAFLLTIPAIYVPAQKSGMKGHVNAL